MLRALLILCIMTGPAGAFTRICSNPYSSQRLADWANFLLCLIEEDREQGNSTARRAQDLEGEVADLQDRLDDAEREIKRLRSAVDLLTANP